MSISTVRRLIRDVFIPLGGLVLIFLQQFSEKDRPSLIIAAFAMMGFPIAALGARLVDQKHEEDPPTKEGGS